MPKQYGLKHLAIATVIIFVIVFAADMFRARDRTGAFHPRTTCLSTVKSLATSARASGSKPAQDQVVYRAVADARKAGLTGEQPSALALYMNFSAHSSVFDTTSLGRQLVDVVCGPADSLRTKD